LLAASNVREMLPAERRARIVAALRRHPAVRVASLSEELGVSEITIRRDLLLLEQEGVLARTYGGAMRRQRRTDEPGYQDNVLIHAAQKDQIAQAAAAHNKDPQAYCDEISGKFQEAWKELKITNDAFIRTTSPEHVRSVQTFLKALWDKGVIFQARYQGKYCVQCERFYAEDELIGGPVPGPPDPARGAGGGG